VNLRRQAVAGARWTSISALLVNLLNLLQLAVLTRLLAPAEFGLMAIMLVVVGFAQTFVDMGVSNAVIHHQDVSRSELSSLYWMNLAAGLLLAVVVAGLSQPIAVFYGSPGMERPLLLLSLVFPLTAAGNLFRTLNQKHLRFARIARIEISAASCACAVAIVLALRGAGVFALVGGVLAQAVMATAMLLICARRDAESIAMSFRLRDLGRFLSFGLFQMGEKVVAYLQSQLDVLMLGKLLGADVTGIYSIAKTAAMRLVSVLNPIVTRVSLPIMAQLQNDDVRLRSFYLRTVSLVAAVTAPVFLGLAVFAGPVIHLLFGPSWQDSVPVLRWVALGAMMRSFMNPVGTLLLAKGRADWGFWWNMAILAMTPVVLYLGSRGGVVGVACVLTVLSFLLWWPMWRLLVRPLCGSSLAEQLRTVSVPTLLALVSVGAVAPLLLIGHPLAGMALAIPIATGIYVWLFSRWRRHDLSVFVSVLPVAIQARMPVAWRPAV
jgi:O-antigen/teichoic acid export membrane protein